MNPTWTHQAPAMDQSFFEPPGLNGPRCWMITSPDFNFVQETVGSVDLCRATPCCRCCVKGTMFRQAGE